MSIWRSYCFESENRKLPNVIKYTTYFYQNLQIFLKFLGILLFVASQTLMIYQCDLMNWNVYMNTIVEEKICNKKCFKIPSCFFCHLQNFMERHWIISAFPLDGSRSMTFFLKYFILHTVFSTVSWCIFEFIKSHKWVKRKLELLPTLTS